ncbi:MAG: hypothetical protein A2735_00910 [Candidatus Yanofskybacteria bacterium RIFCSPHIGHO2_01_FULL_41_21]|uniref:DUF5667 domain-containing protein n=1 Tax=Candidatus Yanofskybacteria bacterium RIFCSPHIGHO2_01_FULL_41_21 TaxID=1802660 RepID=A0A1F8EB16_9BACT|nr:MAG: hypothetical protein A2735_00910 [Candidatus Yanofskybacteria bacterium RIFCSPHIGHO2_01_FULL_41_21]
MINFIKEQLVIRRLKKYFREYTQPDRAFLKSAKLRFVTIAEQKSDISIQAKHPRLWKYATVAIVAIFSMTSGMIVFADVNNVSATNPFYNFKRISEQIRIGLSSSTKQIELHQIFAHRRLEEVVKLEENNLEINKKDNQNNIDKPISSESKIRIDKLNKDFEDETEAGLDDVQDPKIKKEVRQKFCQDILDTIKKQPDNRRDHVADRVKIKCDEGGIDTKQEQGKQQEQKED